MVYIDETYIDFAGFKGKIATTASGGSQPMSEEEKVMIESAKFNTNRGHRLICMHALTCDGMLGHPLYIGVVEGEDELGNPILSLDRKLFSAECIWESKVEGDDYHKGLRGDIFLTWLISRLQPTFELRYGRNARMVLVLDSTCDFLY
jgi:hypothetical protein